MKPAAVPTPLPKPLYGSACNGCGQCCQAELCVLGDHLFGNQDPGDCDRGPCPALQPDGDAFRCGLVQNPEIYAAARTLRHGRNTLVAAAHLLTGAGLGCDAQLKTEPDNPPFHWKLLNYRQRMQKELRRAAKLWGLSL